MANLVSLTLSSVEHARMESKAYHIRALGMIKLGSGTSASLDRATES